MAVTKNKSTNQTKAKRLPVVDVAPLPLRKQMPKERLSCAVDPRALTKLDDMCAQVNISRGTMIETMIFENRSSAFERLKDLEGANMRLVRKNKTLEEALMAERSKHQYELAKLKRQIKG